LEEKQKKIEHVLTQKSSTDAGDRTKTLSASAVPPVLNYWNNNWRY